MGDRDVEAVAAAEVERQAEGRRQQDERRHEPEGAQQQGGEAGEDDHAHGGRGDKLRRQVKPTRVREHDLGGCAEGAENRGEIGHGPQR